jgi:hypothetical protein
MTDTPAGEHQARWTRRELLGVGGSLAVAAGSGVLAGCTSRILSSGPGGQRPSSGQSSQRPRSSSQVGQVRRFRSRPDLRPVSTVVRTNHGGTAPGLIFLGPYSNRYGQQGPMIVDNRGELVWFKPLSDHASKKRRAFNVRVQHYRGEKVLTYFDGAVVSGHGQGSYVIADSSYRQIHRVHAGNGYQGDLHEFLITDEGTALFTCYAERHADLSAVGGPTNGAYFDGVVQEVDIATGRVLFQWRLSKHIRFADSYAPWRSGSTWDPYHVNSISVADDGNLIVSSRNAWTVCKVDRRSGKVLWRLGGKQSDFTVGPRARFAWQHHVTWRPGSQMTVFDNELGVTKAGSQSRGLLLAVDEKRRRATLIQQYLHPAPQILAGALGSVQILPDGHIFVGWGKPYVTEYHRDGTVIYDAEMKGDGTRSYRAFRAEWTGRPQGRPALAVETITSGLALYMSWNGDTEVRRWAVLTGDSAGDLTTATVAPRDGFETKIKIQSAPYVAVAGLDGNGKELGRSAVHAT